MSAVVEDSNGVRLNHLSQGYGRRAVLSDISMDLSPGITALVGPNGAGKSTLLKTIATIIPLKKGNLSIAGTAIRDRQSVRLARKSIGYLPQDFGADPSFTVYEFVLYIGWLRQLPKTALHESVENAINSVGMGERANSRFRTLSGGMRQRAGLAAAIVGSPQVVVLDEPTVGLDPEQRIGFRELLRTQRSATVILSTHLIEDVSAVADRVILLDHGTIRFDGSIAELRERADPAGGSTSQLENAYVSALRGTSTS